MNREYHKWFSPRLGRDMELLVFGHAGLPILVFPTSGGRFYEFEDRQMVAAVAGNITMLEAKIAGITPDMLSFNGRNDA